MNFHLDLPVPAFSRTIHYQDKLFFIGSCFAENIAAQLHGYKFNTLLNPHGILYNPESIATAISRYVKNELYEEQDLFFDGERYHSWEHHSRFSGMDKAICLSEINGQLANAHQFLKTAGWLFVTFGSAYVYRHIQAERRVGNCHKQPLQNFTKELLSVDEMVETFQSLLEELNAFNPRLKIILTVSPVRYIRDGLVENNRSKARLIELTYLLSKHENIIYFPAYELVIDDLRDYRFYKADLVHPNEQAIAYVFEKFIRAALDENTKQILEKIKDLIKAKSHQAFLDESPAHQRFKVTYFNRCRQLQKEYPFLSLEEELEYFRVPGN